MYYRIVGMLSYVIVTFAWAFVWNLVLFPQTYHAMANQSLRVEPIIPLGFSQSSFSRW